ncbi:MAG: PKD domain-containing protein [Deltaproteobacteria bacterium]|nr:PKD domain-containing protein [Deltaproteobacteria bacterium]
MKIAWVKRLKSILFLCISISLFIIVGCAGSGDDNASAKEEKDLFYLSVSTDELTERYRDCSIGTAVTVSFNKALALEPAGTGTKSLAADDDMSAVEGAGLMKVFKGEQLEEITGTLYLSGDGRELTFVPDELLAPGAAYTVLVSSVIRSIDDDCLGEDYCFQLATNDTTTVVDILADPAVILQGEQVTFAVDSTVPYRSVLWTFNSGDADSVTSYGTGPLYTYNAPGIYRVTLNVEDIYGREFTAGKDIRVFKNIAAAMTEKGGFLDVQMVDPSALDEGTLSSLVDTYSEDVLAAVTADVYTSGGKGKATRAEPSRVETLAEIIPGRPLTSLAIRPERIASFGADYIKTLIREGRFLGIVSFKGFPTILSYYPLNDYYVLEMFVNEGNINVQYRDDIYDIDITSTEMSPTPWLHQMSIPICQEVLDNLQRYLPKMIRRPLDVFYTRNGFFRLDTIEEARETKSVTGGYARKWNIGGSFSLGPVTFSASVGSGGVSADVDVDDSLTDLYNLLTGDLIDLLTGLKDFVLKIVDMNPFQYLEDVKDGCEDIKTEFVSLHSTFSSAGGIVTGATDPAALIGDVRDLLYTSAGASVKSVAEEAINVLNCTGGAFELISEPLLAVGDAGTFLAGFVPSLSTDSYIVFHVGTDELSLKVKAGSVQQTLSLDTLNTLLEYADTVLDELGADFPLSDVVSKMGIIDAALGSGVAGEVGFYYTGSRQELKFQFSVLTGSTELFRLRVMLSPTSSGLDIKVTNPLQTDTYVLLEYQPFSLPSGTDDTVAMMFDILALASSPFPDITLTMQTKYRDIIMQITSRLRPDYGFTAYINLGVELDYYIGIGGKGEVGVQIYVGVDGSAISGEVVKNAAKSAFTAGRDSFSQFFSTVSGDGGSYNRMNFPDEDQFIDFLYTFMGDLRTQLVANGVAESLLGAVTVGISPSAEIGIGLGAGGTGTGGGAVNLSLGTAFDMNANLLFFRDTLLAYYRNKDVNTFLMTPLMESMEAMNASDRSNPFDVKGIAKLFEEGFMEIIEQLPAGSETETTKYNAINGLFNSMAQNVSFGLSFQAGIDGELEEGGDIEAGFALGPSISANGEFVFNTLYPVLSKALTLKGAPQTIKDRLIVLDQPGIFPEVSFTLPLSGSIELGFDEAVQVNLGVGAQMNFIEGTVTLQGDPFRTVTAGGIYGTKKLRTYPVVAMTQSPSTAVRGQAVTFSVSQSELKTGTTIADTTWYINGQEITGNGAVIENSETIATVTDTTSATAITFTPGKIMEYRVRCDVTDSDGRNDFDYIVYVTANQVPTQPVLTLLDNAQLTRIDRIPLSATDPDGDPLTFEVKISWDAGFTNVLYSYTFTGTEIALPYSIIDGNSYYIKVRAYDGMDYGPWSAVKYFSVIPLPVELISPVNGQNFIYGAQDIITFEWDSDADYYDYRFMIADNTSFVSPIVDEFAGTARLYEFSGTELEGTPPGVYYWRVAGYNLQAEALDWGETWSFTLGPPPTVLYDPAHKASISHTQPVHFEVEDPGDVDSFEFQYSVTPSFGWGNVGNVSTSTIWETGPLPVGTYFWRARTLANGIPSAWTEARMFWVTNTAPSKVTLTGHQKGGCIDGTLKLNFTSTDPDGDAITYLVYLRAGADDGGGLPTYDLLKSYTVTQNQITFDLTEGGYDFYVDIQAMDALGALSPGWDKNQMFHAYTYNCPPEPPKPLSPIDGYEVIRDNVTLTAQVPTDPDGDPITQYIFLIKKGATEIQKTSAIPQVLVTDLEQGEYTWKVRAVSGTIVGVDMLQSGYGEERRFTVLDNQAPETINESPADGSVFPAVNWITLTVQVNDPEEDEILSCTFELADSSSVVADYKDIHSSSVEVGMQLPPEIYYWRAFAADAGGPGEFGPATCFSVIDGVIPPNIAGAEVGNEIEFLRVDGVVALTFKAHTYTTNCLGEFTGTLEYEIRDDESVLAVPIGNFENGVPFGLELPVGDYFWKARHVVAGMASAWSEPLVITVQEANERPLAENLTPVAGAIFNTDDDILLTMNATDPDEDPIQSHDFQYDPDPEFSEPVEFTDLPVDSVGTGTLTPGIYYWRCRAADEIGEGDWSEPTCFTVIDTVAVPDIEEAGNPTSYRQAAGELEITFHAVTDLRDCLENPVAGVLHYKISYSAGDDIVGTFENGVPFSLELAPGDYVWRAQHEVAGILSGWTEPFAFEVLEENGLPLSENVTPEAGAVFPIENVITLTLGVTDPDEDPILMYDFEYDTSAGFDDDPQQVIGAVTGSVDIVPPVLPADTYYWHGRAADAEGYGDWSQPTCFSVVANVATPNITDAGNATEFEEDDGEVDLTFNAITYTTNCLEQHVGELRYQIAWDDEFEEIDAEGVFVNGVAFTLEMNPGSYYWRAAHVVEGVWSEWSAAETFTVTEPVQALFSEDFESGLGDWSLVQSGAGIFVLETIVDGDSTVFHYRRSNSNGGGGEGGIQQSLDAIGITGYSAVYLEFDVKLISHSLTNSGSWTFNNGGTGEFPADVLLYFTDTNEDDYIWNHGFMLNVDSYGRQNYTVLTAGQWYHYTSPNLIGEQTTQTPGGSVTPIPSGTIGILNTLRLRGHGWDFEGEFDNVTITFVP